MVGAEQVGASETFHLSKLDIKTAGMPHFPIPDPLMKKKETLLDRRSSASCTQSRRGTPRTCWTWGSFVPSTCQRADRPVCWKLSVSVFFPPPRSLSPLTFLSSAVPLSMLPSTPTRAQGASANLGSSHTGRCVEQQRSGPEGPVPWSWGALALLSSREQNIYVIVMRYS